MESSDFFSSWYFNFLRNILHSGFISCRLFQKRKEGKPTKFVEEEKMIKETVDRKDLSTSCSTIEGEGPEEKMIRKTSKATVRQPVKEVSTSNMALEKMYWIVKIK